jgi:hypothetical protein
VSTRTVELPDVRIVSMSPDGSSIVGVRPAIGYAQGELCTFSVATLAERACTGLADLGSIIRLEDLAWSPDGTKLAYTVHAFRTLKDGDLWLMDVATGQVTNLDDDGFDGTIPFRAGQSDATITVDVSPVFTPDGATVTFSRSTFSGGPKGNDIANVPVAGGKPSHLVDVSDEVGIAYFGMRWTADASTLYYTWSATDPKDIGNGIWSVAADGSYPHIVAGATDTKAGFPAVAQVASTGDRLLAWYPLASIELTGRDTLALIDAMTGIPTPLTVDEPSPSVAAVQMATFSPHGTALLEVTIRTEPDHQVRIRDVATGAVTPLIPDGLPSAGPMEYGIMPTWATNGTVLITGGGDLSRATLLTLEGGLADGS